MTIADSVECPGYGTHALFAPWGECDAHCLHCLAPLPGVSCEHPWIDDTRWPYHCATCGLQYGCDEATGERLYQMRQAVHP